MDRNLDHLIFDTNLYEFMRSLIPFNIKTNIASINTAVLGDQGLIKESTLNIYYNDTFCKREIMYDLILNTILPKDFKDIEIDEGQDMMAVIIDIQGSFQLQKFMDKLKQYFSEKIEPKIEDKSEEVLSLFVSETLKNLTLYNCLDCIEFSLMTKAFSQFLKDNKNVGLVIADGLHLIESQDEKESEGQAFIMDEMPEMSDFFSNQPKQKQSFTMIQKRGFKGSKRTDLKAFETKILDSGLSMLKGLQSQYQFAFVKIRAKMFLRKTAEFQENIMSSGVDTPENFRETQGRANYDNDKWQPLFVGHLNSEDEQLKDKLRAMTEQDWFILRGDKRDCLNPSGIRQSINDLVNQHLSCIIKPIPGRIEKKSTTAGKALYFNRCMSLFVLYALKNNTYDVSDTISRYFII